MKTRLTRIRNVAFWMMLLAAFLGLGMPQGWIGVPGTLFGVPGLVVLLLTFWVRERLIQKLFFILAGGAAAALFITLVVFNIMRFLGHTPAGDGGGITVPMIMICPPLFVVGAVGSMVFLIKAKPSEPGSA
jgi:hypothetical protein